jgi:hypothetical protein
LRERSLRFLSSEMVRRKSSASKISCCAEDALREISLPAELLPVLLVVTIYLRRPLAGMKPSEPPTQLD